jgi:3-deoxy-manno-octulosonate cytidylyltransferase (CMP-KDO synthetase)
MFSLDFSYVSGRLCGCLLRATFMLHFDVQQVGPTELQRLTTTAIIPARFQSTRLPGKPLLDIAGLPMIVRVYDRVRETPGLDDVLVATDDARVHETVLRHGGRSVMTSAEHRSGTDRLAEVARGLTSDLIVNVQGDEPLIEPAVIAAAIGPFGGNARLQMSTIVRPLDDEHEFHNPHVVKAVLGLDGFALYFSRAAVPYQRATGNRGESMRAFKHIGLYVYRRETLLELAALPQSPLEVAESLEQLRALEHGIRIKAVETRYDSIGVDTPEDLERVRGLCGGAASRAHDHAEC